MNYPIKLLMILALLSFASLPDIARAAESYDNCTGTISSLPAVITTQGTWCLKNDLSTSISAGSAIEIQTDNVTIDCNGFALTGLTGTSAHAAGISAVTRLNASVRHCVVRGFFLGLVFSSNGGGHTVEDNRFEGNTGFGIQVEGDGSVVRRNRVFNTGGSDWYNYAYGIYTTNAVDIIDNTVSGVTGSLIASGIESYSNPSGSISGNRVRGVAAGSTSYAVSVNSYGNLHLPVILRNNDLVNNAGTNTVGIYCPYFIGNTRDNVISGFGTGISGCVNNGGNVIKP